MSSKSFSKSGFKGTKGNPKRDKSFKAKSQSNSGYSAYKSGKYNKREYKFSPFYTVGTVPLMQPIAKL
jgi:hypothetical protein